MRALLICPGFRSALAGLSSKVPLACCPFASTSLVEAWLEHLSSQGATEVLVLATDRPEQVRRMVADGARWGLSVRVFPEHRELTVDEALEKHRSPEDPPWLAEPHGAVLMDHLPGAPEGSLLKDYSSWFQGVRSWMDRSGELLPAGIREVHPGVFIGARTRVSPNATLVAPCWVGCDSRIAAGAVVGPHALIEDRVSVGRHSIVRSSFIGPETLVGTALHIEDSIVLGNRLIHHRTASLVTVTDPFLLQPLRREGPPVSLGGWMGRILAVLLILITSPMAVWGVLVSKLRGQPALRALSGVRIRSDGNQDIETFLYAELTAFEGPLKRLPQLWSVARGDFRWVGNRPLSPSQAAELTTEFERLALAGPIGLFSPGDRLANADPLTHEVIADASYYTVHANWRTDSRVLAESLMARIFHR